MAEDKAAKKEIKPYVPPKECPKCGSRMANHADRHTCGKCGYTEFKSQAKDAQTEQKPTQEPKKAQKQKQQGKKSPAV
ncbi:Ribosomal protein S27a domain protein [mine drainage metagenome]|uniref:Ribosomal protein S27a domain protein n=1 Tax=mine drainage metagenome TaxID=410659 RepID=T1B007_9ZZZZ